jgi:hypothetical protein
MKWLRFILGTALLTAFVIFTALQFGGWQTRWLTARINALEEERGRLLAYVERLSSARRVAQIEVLEQTRTDSGTVRTRIRWQEIAADGLLGTPLEIEVSGSLIYVEALVLKFAYDTLTGDEPEKGASLALFRRVFGEQQAPQSGVELDRSPPPFLAGLIRGVAIPSASGRGKHIALPPSVTGSSAVPSRHSPREQQLWGRFWEFVDNPQAAREFGVRVAQIEAPAAPMRPGQIWEVSLETAGGLNLRMLAEHR